MEEASDQVATTVKALRKKPKKVLGAELRLDGRQSEETL
jgi:hypothetical protein